MAIRMKHLDSDTWLHTVAHYSVLASFLHDFGGTLFQRYKEIITKFLNVMGCFQLIQVLERRLCSEWNFYVFIGILRSEKND